MDELDTALMIAFGREQRRVMDDAAAGDAAAQLARRAGSKVVSANLRSLALVLRACDSRVPDDNAQGVVTLDAERVRAWCGPVAVAWPGVSLDEATELFGVNRTTVSRWADPPPEEPPAEPPEVSDSEGNSTGRMPVPPKHKRVTWKQDVDRQIAEAEALHAGDRFGGPSTYRVVGRRLNLEYTVNRANRKRDVVRVWTPRVCGLDPGGGVWAGPWGVEAGERASGVPGDFSQVLTRVDRRLSAKSRVWQWVCPSDRGGCGRLVYKVFLPLPVWTIGASLGLSPGAFEAMGEAAWARGFVCHRCAKLVYESSERGSSPGARADGGRRRVDVMDRFAKRISGGSVTGRALRGAGVGVRKSEN